MENISEKRYYVNFYDMIDGWGLFGFYTDRLFDDLDEAKKLSDRLNSLLGFNNKACGEHYGVMDSEIGEEIYCGLEMNRGDLKWITK